VAERTHTGKRSKEADGGTSKAGARKQTAPRPRRRVAAEPPAPASRSRRDAAARVLRRFRVVFSAVRNHFRGLESTVGISGAQVWALSQVAAHPGMGVGQLARAMDVHQSTASNLVRALIEAGMVASERSTADQRAVHLHATAKGLKLLAGAPAPFVGVLPDALRRLDHATLERLDGDLEQVIRELNADPRGAQVIIAIDS
jgi:DNA-binding MarR family transcriptional regulator